MELTVKFDTHDLAFLVIGDRLLAEWNEDHMLSIINSILNAIKIAPNETKQKICDEASHFYTNHNIKYTIKDLESLKEIQG